MVYCIPGLPVYPLLLIQSNQLDTTVFCPAGWRIVALIPLSFAITLTSPHALRLGTFEEVQITSCYYLLIFTNEAIVIARVNNRKSGENTINASAMLIPNSNSGV